VGSSNKEELMKDAVFNLGLKGNAESANVEMMGKQRHDEDYCKRWE
jgi:hypothetical protein